MGDLTRYNAANINQLLDRITRNSIGMEDYFDRIFDLHETTSNYIRIYAGANLAKDPWVWGEETHGSFSGFSTPPNNEKTVPELRNGITTGLQNY